MSGNEIFPYLSKEIIKINERPIKAFQIADKHPMLYIYFNFYMIQMNIGEMLP